MNKTLLTTIAASAVAMGAFAQGQFTLSASSGLVKFSTDSGATTANISPVNGQATIAGQGSVTIQVWSATAGTAVAGTASVAPTLSGGWALDTFNLIKIFPQAGAISPTTIVTPAGSGAVSGGNVEVEIVGWAGTATTFAQAVADNDLVGWSGAKGLGPLGWLQATAVAPNGTPPTTTAANGGFSGLVLQQVPEPTTLALGGLGAAALLMFRRRK